MILSKIAVINIPHFFQLLTFLYQQSVDNYESVKKF